MHLRSLATQTDDCNSMRNKFSRILPPLRVRLWLSIARVAGWSLKKYQFLLRSSDTVRTQGKIAQNSLEIFEGVVSTFRIIQSTLWFGNFLNKLKMANFFAFHAKFFTISCLSPHPCRSTNWLCEVLPNFFLQSLWEDRFFLIKWKFMQIVAESTFQPAFKW